MEWTDSEKLTVIAFVIGFITGVVAFLILFPFTGEGWALEGSGIVFLVFLVVTYVVGTVFPG
jgi:hypothetical protein